jgi:hypothetical protein
MLYARHSLSGSKRYYILMTEGGEVRQSRSFEGVSAILGMSASAALRLKSRATQTKSPFGDYTAQSA